MNVCLLTSKPYWKFVVEIADQHPEHDFWISEATTFPKEYDVGVSFMHLGKVPKEQLTKPWFNFHPAPLPEYKGRNLCYHAIMNGAKEFGATVHYMDEEFDTGDIIDVCKFPLLPSYTAQAVSDLALACSRKLFAEYFPRIIAGEEFKRHPNVGGTYYKKCPVSDYVILNQSEYHIKQQIRAITYGSFYPKTDIGGVTYKIVRDDE